MDYKQSEFYFEEINVFAREEGVWLAEYPFRSKPGRPVRRLTEYTDDDEPE